MASKEEEINKQLKQLEKLTPEQIVNGLRLWLAHEDEQTLGKGKPPIVPSSKK